jgi:hypothetical protein
MIQARPSSSTGLQATSPHQFSGGQGQRNHFHSRPSSHASATSYRGSGPIKPYAFTSTPSLNPTSQWQQSGASKSAEAPTLPPLRLNTNSGSASPEAYVTGSKDDSYILQQRLSPSIQRPEYSHLATPPSTQVSFAQSSPVRASPDRYRRPAFAHHVRSQSAQLPNSGVHAVNSYTASASTAGSSRSSSSESRPSTTPASSTSDVHGQRHRTQEEMRYRRRSMHTIDSADYPNPITPHVFKRPGEATRAATPPSSAGSGSSKYGPFAAGSNNAVDIAHSRSNSSESIASSRSSHSRPTVSSISRSLALAILNCCHYDHFPRFCCSTHRPETSVTIPLLSSTLLTADFQP